MRKELGDVTANEPFSMRNKVASLAEFLSVASASRLAGTPMEGHVLQAPGLHHGSEQATSS